MLAFFALAFAFILALVLALDFALTFALAFAVMRFGGRAAGAPPITAARTHSTWGSPPFTSDHELPPSAEPHRSPLRVPKYTPAGFSGC